METDKCDLDSLQSADDTKNIQSPTKPSSKFKRNHDVQFDLGSHLHFSILPLLQQPTTNLSKHDVINLANTLIKLKKYILDFQLSFSIEFKDFFYSLVALSSNCLITNSSAITKNQVQLTCEACSILISYLLHQMSTDNKHNQNEDIAIKFQKLNLIHAFCGQTNNLLSKNELDSLCAILKSSKLPPELSLNDKSSTTSKSSTDSSDLKEFKRIKIDRVDYLIDHLSLPISVKRNNQTTGFSFVSEDQDKDVKQNVFQRNLLTLRQLDANETLLEFISKFPNIKINLDYLNQLKTTKEVSLFNDKINIKDDLKSNLDEFTKLVNTLSLSIFDNNLNENCLKLVLDVIQSSLYASVNLIVLQSTADLNSTTSETKNHELKERHSLIKQLTNLILKFYKNKLNGLFKNNQKIVQNIHLFTTWIMFAGLEELLNKSKSIQQEDDNKQNITSITYLCSSIVNHALETFGFILDDLVYDFNKDSNSLNLNKNQKLSFYHQFNIQQQLSASKRVQMLLNEISILPLILDLSYSSFIYACDRFNKTQLEDETANQDNQVISSQRNYDRFISNLDKEFSSDDDSEPIFGRLFNENDESKKNEQNLKQDLFTLEKSTNEIQDSIEISKSVIMFLNVYFICAESEYERNVFKKSLDVNQIELIANVIKKLDCLDEDKQVKEAFKDFSKSYSLFIHNLIATESLTEEFESKLLEQLNVHPTISSKEDYRFFIKPRALSVLAQMLMCKIKNEKDVIKSNKNALSLSMWKGVLDRLIELIKTKDTFLEDDSDDEDINFEHAQLLMFVFHNLTLLQRKQIALDLCQRIFDLSDFLNLPANSRKSSKDQCYLTNRQLLYLSRILHFFEYIIRNLYEIPQHLIEQINSNLFEFHSSTRTSININNTSSSNNTTTTDQQFELSSKLSNCLKEHRKVSNRKYDKYYDLLCTEHKQFEHTQRLNDIALNFLFYFKSDKLRYERFYKGVMQFLLIGNYFNSEVLNEKDQCQCNIQYCFYVIWRLFLLLPPSIQFLEESSIEEMKQDSLKMLSMIIWQPRLIYSKYYRNFLLATIKKQTPNEENTDQIIDSYLKYYTPISFNIELIKSYVDDYVNEDKVPSLFDQFILECLISRLWIMLDYSFTKKSNSKLEQASTNEQILNLVKEYSTKLPDYLSDILIVFTKLVRTYCTYFKDSLLRSIEFKQKDAKSNFNLLKAYNDILSISADEYFSTNAKVVSFFPITIKDIWNFIEDDKTVNDLLNETWKAKVFKGDLPTEQLIMENCRVHFFQLSTTYPTTKQDLYSSSQLAYTILILLRSTESLINWFKTHHKQLNENDKLKELVTVNFMKIITPLNIDYTLQSFSDFCRESIDYIWDMNKNEEFQIELKLKVLEVCYSLVTEQYDNVDVDTKVECVNQFKFLLNSYAGQSSLESFFCDNLPSFSTVDIMVFFKSAARKEPGNKYAVAMLKFLIKLIEETDQNLESVALVRLCSLLKKIGDKQEDGEENWIEKWFHKLLCIKDEENGNNGLMSFNEENYQLIKKLADYIMKGTSIVDESVSQEFVKSLITIATSFLNTTNDKISFSELMVLMTTLANSKDNGTSHFVLIKASINWLNICTNYLSKTEVLEKIELGITVGRHQIMLHSVSYVLSYLELVFEALRSIEEADDNQTQSTTAITDNQQSEVEWTDDLGCDDTTSEGSEEDLINSRLCTFTVTQKEFMNQHWYHCHTCKMVDGVGVCSICARVCHKSKGHDVTYSKHGSFFCDCGVKEDGSCQALTERTSTIEKANVYKLPSYIYSKDDKLATNQKKLSTDSSVLPNISKKKTNLEALCRQFKDHKDAILAELKENNVCSTVVKLLKFLSKPIVSNNQRFSPIDSAIRTRNTLEELHKIPKTGHQNNMLAVPTLGSQEGAFENIKTNYSGEQGQRIKCLMSNNLLKRVGMTMLNQTNGKKQHLAISHEKGKITILQLSSLLKQIDSSKKKISLTRLSSASVPFTILTIASNSSNDSVLSVCGLKDCHVLTFNSSGHLSGHLILQLNLKKVNYIIKSIWLPSSQSELAIITADFVSIYNLSESLSKPVYCFELPEKIRDATFLFTSDGKQYFLFLSILGEVYYEQLNPKSQSQNTPYFVTSQIEFKFKEEFQSVIGRYFNDGGASIFYSHLFQLLFISYENGTTLAIPMKDLQQDAKTYFLINVLNNDSNEEQNDSSLPKSSVVKTITSASETNESTKTTKPTSKFKPICNWSEVANHPGLIMASTRDENNPILFSITPESISYQEVKENIKSKIIDTVAIRHSVSNSDFKTTLVVLCEDGSLQIFNAFNDYTNYWLNPMFNCKQIIDKQGLVMNACSKAKKSKKSSRKLLGSEGNSNREISFPIDFFESTQQINDIEFGGNDLLQVYNSTQLKNRLFGQATYIACTKANGFTLEITNNDPSMVVVGIRVLLGSQSVAQSPSYIEVFDRYINIQLSRYRWFDIPFTKEETLIADRKFSIFFGPPNDASSTTYVDSVLVYGKSRDLFLWPYEESENCNNLNQNSSVQNQAVSSDLDIVSLSCLYVFDLNILERVLCSSFEIVNYVLLIKNMNTNEEDSSSCLALSTDLLTLPFPLLVHQKLKNLLLQLHSSKQLFYNYRDTTVLNYVLEMLLDHKELYGEPFLRVLNLIKSILGYRSSNFSKFVDVMLDDFNNNAENKTTTKFVRLLIETFDLNVEKEKLTVKTIFTCLMNYLDKLYWNFYRKWPKYHLVVYSEGNLILELITQTLVEVIYCFTLVNEDYMSTAMDIYMKFFCADNTVINYNTRQALMQLLRSKKLKKSKQNTREDLSLGMQSEPKKSINLTDAQSLAEIVQLNDDDSDNNIQEFVQQHPGRFIEDFENQYPDLNNLNNLANDLINDSVNEEDVIERLPLYQILNESLLDNDEELLDNNEISINLPDQELVGLNQQALSSSSSFQQQHSSEQQGKQTPSADNELFKDLNFDKLASTMNDFNIPNVNNEKTHNIKILLLEHMIKKLGQIKSVGGIRSIPFMQIVLMISFELDAKKEKEKQILIKLINGLLEQLKTDGDEDIIERNPVNEVKLIIMRLLSILLSKFKSHAIAVLSQKSPTIKPATSKDQSQQPSTSSTTSASTEPNQQKKDTVSLECAKETVKILVQSDLIEISLKVLNALIKYWTEYQQQFESTRAQKQTPVTNEANQMPKLPILKTSQSVSLDMSPFFIKQQFLKGHTEDVLELFPQLLSEMVIRLPYQIKKLSNILNLKTTFTFDEEWTDVLCQYMMLQLTPYVRKQIRKLLTFICGSSKEKYRQARDFYSLNTYIKEINKLCLSNTPSSHKEKEKEADFLYSFSYDNTILLIENLKSVLEIATNRSLNWQKFCYKNPELLCFFVKVSIFLDESVSNTILQLLQLAICAKPKSDQQAAISTAALLDKLEQKDKTNKKEDITVELVETVLNGDESKSEQQKSDNEQQISYVLAKQLISKMDTKLLSDFVRTFLLESNNTQLRWQCHSLIYKMFENFNEKSEQRIFLLDSLWYLWDSVTKYGQKAAQFVDLLGYFTYKTPNTPNRIMQTYVEKTLNILNQQNQLLFQHPNYMIYNNLQKIVNFDGYYLESEPCLVCNNPETNYSNLKLSSLKVDSRFTTTTQIVKLVSSHIISKINLRITDIKKTKMVKVINIYYNNSPVNSVVELKNRTVWHKAKRCYLNSGQSEVKFEFPLPITACNLKIEYAEFYENQQANNNETLQCPRCSTTVPTTPGVCSNCSENIFQCLKCRSINYDEKDPYLCNSCGHCRFCKFDFILLAKPTCAVDPIKDEDGRKKTVQNINSLLERADTVFKQLNAIKPTLEILLLKYEEHGFIDKMPEESAMITSTASITTAAATQSSQTSSGFVNKTVQQIAFKYCNECKTLFEELSKIIQRLLASRKELVIYDNVQRLESYTQFCDEPAGTRFIMRRDSKMFGLQTSSSGKCYGCLTASIDHCVTLLKGLANLPAYRELFYSNGLNKILVDQNLKLNNLNLRREIRQLLSLLLKDNQSASEQLEKSINIKIDCLTKKEFREHLDFVNLIKNEVALLTNALETDDLCWEIKLKCLMRLFFVGLKETDPNILNAIVLPALRIMSSLVKVDSSFNALNNGFSMCIYEWLKNKSSFEQWKSKKELVSDDKNENRLQVKYFNIWKTKVQNKKAIFGVDKCQIMKDDWIRNLIFNKYSLAVRMMTCSFIESFFLATNKKIEIVQLLTSYLDGVNENGICSTEFFYLYTNIIKQDHWKYYLALKGLLPHLGKLINIEIDRLLVLDDENINSDLSDGLTLKLLGDLLISFVDVDLIRHYYKSKLVVFILNGYLSLRKLVVRRTKIIDETQDNLLELLEEMTTGTETETSSFMSVCVQSVKCCKLDDLRTPVFIFERLCSIIYPEDNTTSEFYITLEKDSAQEDFLQGRMLGNPYSSLDPGFGPLMRDIKNKICQDCELVALLDDDSGMELLVMDKIISLDLPVKDVYKKIWCAENNESHPMLIIYRMRGLMGDATEEFIENLDLKNVENENVEEVYKMAKVMSSCGGLEVMLERLNQIKDLTARCKPLLVVLLKLFDHCVKLSSNRKHLIDPKLNTIAIFMKVLKIIINSPAASLSSEQSQLNKTNLLEQILKIIEIVLLECSKQNVENVDQVKKFLSPITANEFEFLLHSLQSENVQKNANVLNLVLRIIPFLVLDSQETMQMVLEHFKPYLNFNKFDYQNTPENANKLECFCIMVNSVEKNEICHKFKDFIVSENVVVEALEYLTSHSPPIKCAMLANSKEWKEFTIRPSLKYVLRILTGITSGHELSQILVTSQYISIIHGLEQVSSDAHVGSLAENLLEALKQNEHVAATIEKVRKETKEEKKRLAMAVRQKQLGELGLKANEFGQVIAKSSVLKQVEDLGDEQGLTCIICREGYKFQPNKVLGIYTFTKKCPIEPYEAKTNKTMGYSTVTHFNIIHFDCHLSAVKHARIRDEWESAALQNGNTKCNGLLPLWGPKVQDSVFESCLVHHNSYLQESTNCREISYTITLHDFKLLLLKFANEESFSIDTGGGGTESNIHLVPYLIHMALYVMNTTNKSSRNVKMVKMFLEEVSSRFVENSFEVENVYYYAAMHVLVFGPNHWNKVRTKFLQRFLITGHARKYALKDKSINSLPDKTPKDYNDYKTELIFFALIDGIYKHMFKNVDKLKDDEDETWSTILADYIRHNDQQLLENAEQLLQFYEQDLLPCSTFNEFCDLVGLLDEITDPQQFIVNALQMV